jgi:ribose transport system substrate-binding protein
MEKGNGTAQGQIEKLRQLASQADVAAVAISVIQAENAAIVEEMKNLAAKGVKVITVDGDVNRTTFRDARRYYIGTDNVVGGRLLGAAAKAILAARGKTSGGYVQFAGFADNDNSRARMNGFKEAVGETFKEADRMSDEMDLARARDNVRTALVNHPDLVALVGIWAYNAPAIAEVVEERKARDRITTVTFDAQAVAIEQMAAGQIDAMVVQNPFEMGIQTVRLLLAMHAGDEATIKEMFPRLGQPDGDIYTTGLRLIVPDADPLVKPADIQGSDHEYLPLSTFRAWLAKYGLSSS